MATRYKIRTEKDISAAALTILGATSGENTGDNAANTSIAGTKLDDFATPDDNTDLNANTTNHGLLVKATAPASGLHNFVGVSNGETVYSNKALFDATNPSTQAFSDSAVIGTAAVAARRDHKHAMPSEVLPANLGDEFKTIVPMVAVAIDWSDGQIFTKTLSSAPTFTFSNLHIGVKFIKTTGDYSPIFPEGFVYGGGTRPETGTTRYQVVCDDTSTPEGIYTIHKDES